MYLKYNYCPTHKHIGRLYSWGVPDKEILELEPQCQYKECEGRVFAITAFDDKDIEYFRDIVYPSPIIQFISEELENRNLHSTVDIPEKIFNSFKTRLTKPDDVFYLALSIYRAFLG